MLIDRFSFCKRGHSSSTATETARVCSFVDVSNICGRREVVLSAGEVAVRDVMMGTRVVDVDMTATEKKPLFRLIRTLRSMEVGLAHQLLSFSGLTLKSDCAQVASQNEQFEQTRSSPGKSDCRGKQKP